MGLEGRELCCVHEGRASRPGEVPRHNREGDISCKDPEAELADERGLTEEDAGEGAAAIHIGVGEQAELLELLGRQQVRLVDHNDDATVTFSLLGFEELLGLGHHLGLEEARSGAQGTDHGDVEAAGAEGGIGNYVGDLSNQPP